ncbi:hypothetical protein FQN55_002789 [Onygenales sp. PD_40]|nr:hypothetical protein FQN55_002789 [Onygenales sp. PD_40]
MLRPNSTYEEPHAGSKGGCGEPVDRMGWSDLDWVVIRRHGDVEESGLTVLSCGERLARAVFKEASLLNQFVKTYLQQWAIGGTVGQRLRDLGEVNAYEDTIWSPDMQFLAF